MPTQLPRSASPVRASTTIRPLLRLTAAALLAAFTSVAPGQTAAAPVAVTTLAGQAGTRQATNGTGGDARFYAPSGLVLNAAGELIVADACNNFFRKVTAAGVVTTFSGRPIDLATLPINIGSADGSAENASFHIGDSASADGPWGTPIYTIVGSYTMARDTSGNIYFADTLNNTIRKIAPDGTVSTIAGQAGQGGTDDGTGANARFLSPSGVALDPSGNLFVADSGNNTIRKVTPGGVVTTFAGEARSAGNVDGAGSDARFTNPAGIAADSVGNLYVTDSSAHTVRKITPAGVVTTLAGSDSVAGASDGSGSVARFNGPTGITVDSVGFIYVADTENHVVRKLTAAGAVSTIAGRAGSSGSTEGTGNASRLNQPRGVAVDAAGVVYISDSGNNAIRKGAPASGAATLQITSHPQRRFAIVGDSISFKVIATGTPAPTYQWRKDGTDIVGATSDTYTIASAQFTDAAFYTVVVSSGSTSFTSGAAQLQVFPGGTPIPTLAIIAQSTDQEVTVGQSANFFVELVGAASPTYQWKKDGANISGATSSTYSIGAAQIADAGVYTVTVTEGSNSVTTAGATLTVNSGATPTAPSITAHPSSQVATAGSEVTFSVSASGSPAPSFQWRKGSTPLANGPTSTGATISGATTSTLTITNVAAGDAGDYSVTVTNSLGFVTSNTATLTIGTATNGSRIINLSINTTLDAASPDFIMSYVVGGANTTGAKPLIIRAAGPTLGQPPFSIPGTVADPKMELYAGTTKTGENDNWGGSASLADAMDAVGAFEYHSPSSLDAAVAVDIATRDNSVKVSANNNGTGLVIAEVYDANSSDTFTATTPRLINVSVRKNVTSFVTAGFVISGSTPKTVLIRAVGPKLADFGVSGAMSDPQLTLFSHQTEIASNNDWGGSAELVAVADQVGAFQLAPNSKDAALLVTLEPADYTAQAKGVGNVTGEVLVEVYEVIAP